jgi:hypothetical protein
LLNAAFVKIWEKFLVFIGWILHHLRLFIAHLSKELGATEVLNEVAWFLLGDGFDDLFSVYRRKDLNPILSEISSKTQIFEEPESLGEDADLGDLFDGLMYDEAPDEEPEPALMNTLRRRYFAERVYAVNDLGEHEPHHGILTLPNSAPGFVGLVQTLAGTEYRFDPDLPTDSQIAQDWIWKQEREEWLKNL